MTADELRALQAPLKERYRADPDAARITMHASGELLVDEIACRIESDGTGRAVGLHPAAGGNGQYSCAAEMLLESLVGCAGTTLCAVASALGLPLSGGVIRARGELDMRGTLGVDRSAACGFATLQLQFQLRGDLTPEQTDRLLQLTERYCVVFQTLRTPPAISLTCS